MIFPVLCSSRLWGGKVQKSIHIDIDLKKNINMYICINHNFFYSVFIEFALLHLTLMTLLIATQPLLFTATTPMHVDSHTES